MPGLTATKIVHDISGKVRGSSIGLVQEMHGLVMATVYRMDSTSQMPRKRTLFLLDKWIWTGIAYTVADHCK
jgi:hypothetical protein